jgi:hypothetical protein
VPGAESFSAASASMMDANGHPRQAIATRVVTIEFHLCAKDIETVELLIHTFVNLVHVQARKACAGYTLQPGGWLEGANKGAGNSWLTRGEAFLLPIQFQIPIPLAADFAAFAEIAITGEFKEIEIS